MTTVKTAEVKEANVELAEELVEAKPKLIDRVKESRLIKFVDRHRIGVAAGVGTAIAAGAAVIVAARNGYVEGVDDAMNAVGDVLEDAVDTVTDSVD